jgi:pyruvoyl-dependent arginine decarboxylase (PvlArgDC)
MGYNSVIEGMIEEKLLDLHTAYIAKVISVNGSKAKVQPLNMVKQYGGVAKKPSPVTAYILNNARYKLKPKNLTYVSDVISHSSVKETTEVMTQKPISAGDIVFCVCADRNITEARKGNLTTPQIGHHSMSDSVIVGIL